MTVFSDLLAVVFAVAGGGLVAVAVLALVAWLVLGVARAVELVDEARRSVGASRRGGRWWS